MMQDLVGVFLSFLATVTAAFFAYWSYLRQREHELVRRRYLDEGVDLLVANVGKALSTFRHNWSLAVSVLKQYKDMDTGLDNRSLEEFVALDQNGMSIVSAYRLRRLVGDGICWDELQNTFAFVDKACSFLRFDLARACKGLGEGSLRLSVSKEQAIREYQKKLEDLDRESYRYYEFMRYLLDVASILERGKFTFKSISRFHDRKDIGAILANMKAIPPKEGLVRGEMETECTDVPVPYSSRQVSREIR